MPEKLPQGWVKTTLGEIRLDESMGISQEQMRGETFELYSVPAFSEGKPEIVLGDAIGSNKILVSPGDVLLCKINPRINRAWVVGESLGYRQIASTEWIVFSKIEGISSNFLRYFLSQNAFRDYLAANVSGVGGSLMRVRPSIVETYPFILPPLAEQNRIVVKLNAALSRVQRAEIAARRAQERLQRYRAAVLQAAVTGELSNNWREAHWKSKAENAETGEILLQRLLTVRRMRWEEIELKRLRTANKLPKDDKWKSRYTEPVLPDTEKTPTLPYGWTWASLDQLLLVLRNGISQVPREVDGLPILRISAVRALSVDLSDYRYLPVSTSTKYLDYALQEGDLLFTRYNGSRNLAGICGRVPSINETIVYPDKIIRGVPVHFDKQLSSYIAIAANCGASRQYIEAHLFTTAGQWGISGRNLRATPLPLPSAVEYIHIVSEVERRLLAADRLATKLEEQISRTSVMRQSLLQQAFDGRLVPQDPMDEPASVLLERIRVAREAEAQKPKGRRMSKSKSKSKAKRRPLLDVLREHKKPMTPEQLFMDSGYQQEFNDNECRQEIVDSFYEELRRLVGPKGPVLEKRPNRNTVLLEVK